ncbi:MAG: OmpA family protein [Pseudomonadota bacterium]
MAIADAYRRQQGRMPFAPARQLGTWKLAYADFLTALVALFLVLWLVNDTTTGNKSALAGYFRGDADITASKTETTPAQLAQGTALMLDQTKALSAFRQNLSVVVKDDNIRIDVIDRQASPMFATGRAELTPEGRRTLAALSDILKSFAWPIQIEGHTDAFPASGTTGDNWTLSLDRADMARQFLEQAGIGPSRIVGITGFGATRPLRAEEPHLAANRRVTLILQVTE